jgi:hypothetical protein
MEFIMGGKLFNTERISRQEYEEVCIFISKTLKGLNHAFPDSFLDKQDFGDIDIICSSTDYVKERLNEAGCIVDINGASVLINYKGKMIQVDLIESSNVPYTLNYYSYGMFGAMVGKLFKAEGFKLNDIGLFYIYNGNDVFVTSDWRKILWTVGIHSCKFTTEEEAFLAIANSGKFKKSIFTDLPEKKLAKAMKRPMYSRFLEYIKDRYDMTSSTDILTFLHSDNDFIRRLQCEDITAKANSALKELVKSHYPYEDFKSRCQDLTARQAAQDYNLLKGYLRTTIMSYFNDRSSQIQRPLSDKAELDMHIWLFGHKVDGIDFKYLPMENIREYQGIEQCRIYQERYMGQERKDN